MNVQHGLDALRQVPAGSTMSIGNFDGVHIGHRAILDAAVAKRDAAGGGEIVAVTFEPHPLSVLRPQLAPPQLTPSPTKHALLRAAGVDRLVVLPPTPDVLGLPADAFFAILRDEARVRALVEGPDFNFGKARSGTIDSLRAWCARDGVALKVADDVHVTLEDRSTVPVSSSLIRWLITKGRVGDAARCLGRPYRIEGAVVGGEKRGRTIGFPTANVACDANALLPADGVYAATCEVDGRRYAVALSIGTKPTFHQNFVVTVEGYLLDFAGDLYGRTLALDLVAWVREQRKYPSLDSLIEELHRDVARVRELITPTS
jgi:riboflavin kinase/FMN adenylyltransferase